MRESKNLRCSVLCICVSLGVVAGCDDGSGTVEQDLPFPQQPAQTGTATTTTSATSDANTGDGTTTETSATQSASAAATGTSTGEEPQSCEGGCLEPPSDCHESEGDCVDDVCVYSVAAFGTPCDDGDACTLGDTCNDEGTCVPADTVSCDRDNAEGGTCTQGECSGWTCVEPYDNCDGDWSNGCEIPVGVPNSCSNAGIIETGGCGTAYCGTELGTQIINFEKENFRCVTCSNCTTPSEGMVAWCNHTTGSWWPAESEEENGSCPAFYEHATCGG